MFCKTISELVTKLFLKTLGHKETKKQQKKPSEDPAKQHLFLWKATVKI